MNCTDQSHHRKLSKTDIQADFMTSPAMLKGKEYSQDWHNSIGFHLEIVDSELISMAAPINNLK